MPKRGTLLFPPRELIQNPKSHDPEVYSNCIKLPGNMPPLLKLQLLIDVNIRWSLEISHALPTNASGPLLQYASALFAPRKTHDFPCETYHWALEPLHSLVKTGHPQESLPHGSHESVSGSTKKNWAAAIEPSLITEICDCGVLGFELRPCQEQH